MEFFVLGNGGKKKTVDLGKVPDTDVAWIMGQKHRR